MGQAIASLIDAADDLQLAGLWRRGEDLDEIVAKADVLVDFSLPEAIDEILAAAVNRSCPLVCGVSGLAEEQMDAISAAAGHVPLVYDRNMSLGVAVLTRSVREAAASLGEEFGVRISEVHHVHKLDSPSGTALKLGEAVESGQQGSEIYYESERRGEVPGDHDVVFTSPNEVLSFSHSVTTRDVFADGALRAARWIVGREPGLYGMQDVLFSDFD